VQRFSLQPEESADNDPERPVGVGELRVAGGEATELLAAGDQPFDDIAGAVDRVIEGAGAMFIAAMGDRMSDAAAAAGPTNPPAAVPLVAHEAPGALARATAPRALDRYAVEQLLKDRRFVRLARRQDDGERLARAFRAEMDLGRVAAPTPAERLLRGPPFPPAACWWARMVVPSTNWTAQSSRPSASARACAAAKIRSQIPARRHRRKRLASVDHGP